MDAFHFLNQTWSETQKKNLKKYIQCYSASVSAWLFFKSEDKKKESRHDSQTEKNNSAAFSSETEKNNIVHYLFNLKSASLKKKWYNKKIIVELCDIHLYGE